MKSIKDIMLSCAALALLVAGCAMTEMASEPKYTGGYPTEETASDFVGTWELSSVERKTEAGDWVPAPLRQGRRSVGIIMYDDKGNMAVQITTVPRSTETPADDPEIVNGYAAYYGTYEVDSQAGTVTHHRSNHINPDLGNLSVVRYYKFSGDTLTLTVVPDQQMRLNWVRVR